MRIIFFASAILLFFVTTANAAKHGPYSKSESTYEATLHRDHDSSITGNLGVQFPTLSKVDFAPAIGLTYLHRIAGQWRAGISFTHSTHHRRISSSKEMITPVLLEGNYQINQWFRASGLGGVTFHGSEDLDGKVSDVMPTFGGKFGFVFYKKDNWALGVDNAITVAIGDESFIAFQLPISMSYRF